MSEPALPDRRMTVDEFLAWDDGSGARYELVDGHVVAMAAPEEAHSDIAGNAYFELRRRLPKGCRIGVEFGLSRPEWTGTYYQADVVVRCGGREEQDGPPPTLIVEVLSTSTARFDRTRKTDDYMTIPSLRQILLIDSTRRWVQSWLRGEDGQWHGTPYIGTATVPLVFGEPVPMEALYEGVSPPHS